MTKVLYVSNIEVPYRSEFFNQLSKKIDLTVLYERRKSSNRDSKWTSSVKSNYNIEYLKGINFKNEYTLDLGILKYVFSNKYNKVVIGCYNSPSQMIAIVLMRLFHRKYILNLDGEYFFDGPGLKNKIKRFFIKGADEYLIAGKKACDILSKYVPKEKVHPYYFSSLTKKELEINRKHINKNINNRILVVGQYFDYKGLDIALEVAKLDESIKYRFIGSGNRSKLLEDKVKEMKLKNVEVISFLSKEELYKEYSSCGCLLLPSRQECWGLVINEAASFGCPIVSTNGSGAAIELIDEEFICNVNPQDIYLKIKKIMQSTDSELELLKKRLIDKSRKYCIENMVDKNLVVFEREFL